MRVRFLILVLAALASAGTEAATFVVTSAADTAGSTCGSTCTLRQAITAANATAAADTVNFAITIPVRGEILIQPTSPLPTITQPLTINGYSQSGTRVNDHPTASNAILRLRIDGNLAGGGAGLAACTPNTRIRGLSITRFSQGINLVPGCDSSGSTIAGNFVGLASSGSAAFGNTVGIVVSNGNGVIVGGTALADRNVIAGNTGNGVVVGFDSTSILNNLIGTDKSGTLDFGQSAGVAQGSNANGVHVIGAIGSPNRIRFNGIGISHVSSSAVLTMHENHISDNDGLGIDLGPNGVTANDANDADTGPNGLQNFPVITAAERVPSGLSVAGSLDIGASQNGNYRITLYASSSCDPSGFGEGERLLGSFTRALISSAETFQINPFTTSDPLPPGTFITATATNPGLATSEFSQCFPLDPAPWVVNSANDVADGVCNAAHCSLRDAIIAANNASDPRPQSIHFNIPTPATGEIMIAPLSSLPTITRSMAIDGYTQPGSLANTDPVVSNAQIRIRIHGTPFGLSICADGTSVRGLAITGTTQTAIIVGSTSAAQLCSPGDDSTIVGNFIGLHADGTTAGNNSRGIGVLGARVRIGGTAPADRNVIAASNSSGVTLINSGIDGSEVLGNLIGTDRSGSLDRGNETGVTVADAVGVNVVQIGRADAPNICSRAPI